MRLFLHIGTGKTGTTTIQTFLEENRENLASRGVFLPTSLGRQNHRNLAAYSANDDVVDNLRRSKRLTTPERVQRYREGLEPRLAADAATWPSNGTVVVTSEQMIKLYRPGEVERLHDLVAPYADTIKIIMYLRRQDEYFVSEYSQIIKGGGVLPFAPKKIKMTFYDYAWLTNRWAKVFGEDNIIVRPFEPEAFRNGDLVEDFLGIVGITDLAGLTAATVSNQSLDANSVEFLRMLKDHLPRWTDEGRQSLERIRMIADLEAVSAGPRLCLPLVEAVAFLARFADGNAAVARRFLGRADGRLFQREPSADSATGPSLTAEQAVEIALAIWRLRDRAKPRAADVAE